MVMIVSKRAGAVLAVAAALCVAASLPALSQGYRPDSDERGNVESQRPHDERGNVEGKRAACETYARVALVQAEANRKYRCGYTGPRWEMEVEPHFHWCRHVRRESLGMEARERAGELQRCFDRLGDFDEEAFEHRR
jgi:hypothetical protein